MIIFRQKEYNLKASKIRNRKLFLRTAYDYRCDKTGLIRLDPIHYNKFSDDFLVKNMHKELNRREQNAIDLLCSKRVDKKNEILDQATKASKTDKRSFDNYGNRIYLNKSGKEVSKKQARFFLASEDALRIGKELVRKGLYPRK